MKKKILITGTSGQIGNLFLDDALKKGFIVTDILRKKNLKNKNLILLRKKFKNNYKSIFFSKVHQLDKKLQNLNFDIFINFATKYKNKHENKDIPKFIESNIIFPSVILDKIHGKTKKFINIGTMMEHVDGRSYSPKNFYASTKSAFEILQNFYLLGKKLKIYNLKFYESFTENDKRKKLIPILIRNFRKNKTSKIISKKLELNIIHVNDIFKAIYIIFNKNLQSGSYCLKQRKNINIYNFIKQTNKKIKKKIKVKFLNQKVYKISSNKLNIIPNWRADNKINIKIQKQFI